MLTFRGSAWALLIAITGLLTLVFPASAPVARAQAEGIILTIDMKLNREGVLEVEQRVLVPQGHAHFTMSLPLRIALDGAERRFAVTDIEATGAGKAEIVGDLFTIDAGPGESTFDFSVRNTVSDAEGSQVFRWFGVLDADISEIHASLISPSPALGVVECLLGPIADTRPCAQIQVEPDGVMYLDQTGLHRGESLDLTLQIPPGTVPANADIESNASPFAVTTPVLIAFGILLLAMAAVAAYVFWARRQSTGAITPIDPLAQVGGRTQFTSPEGLLPGEAGVLLDGHADPTDIAATFVDLAVRRYLWIRQIGEADWQIGRANPVDEQLRPYERAVYEAALPAGTDSVALSELRASGRLPLAGLRQAMLDDAVERGAFIDPKRRQVPLWLGAALIIVGLAVTIGAALMERHALVGVAIALAGLGLLGARQFLPVRTELGRKLTAQVRGLQSGLERVASDQIPRGDRELVFSRGLPYMVVWSRADNWVRTFRDLDPSDDREPGLYWFGGFEGDRDLHRFSVHFPYFITAVESLFPS